MAERKKEINEPKEKEKNKIRKQEIRQREKDENSTHC